MKRIPPFAGQAGREAWERLVAETLNRLSAQSVSAYMAGELRQWPGSVVPAGWLECDGSELLRSSYPALFEAIGQTWGGSDTTFLLPDGRGRAFLGRSDAYAIGTTGGSETVTLTTDELPGHTHGVADTGHAHTFTADAHTHTVTDPGHTHAAADGNFVLSTDGSGSAMADLTPSGSNEVVSLDDILGAAPNTGSATTGISLSSAATTGSISSAATGVTVESAGSGQAFSTLPPYFVGMWIIKI